MIYKPALDKRERLAAIRAFAARQKSSIEDQYLMRMHAIEEEKWQQEFAINHWHNEVRESLERIVAEYIDAVEAGETVLPFNRGPGHFRERDR